MNYDLYVVTDSHLSKGRSHQEVARLACEGGADIIQFRDKDIDDTEFLKIASEIREITRDYGVTFIVNDRLDAAIRSNADGIHVGQDDMKPYEIRSRFPELSLIGLSTHNPEQTRASRNEPIDYIGVGPVYSTPTKEIPDPTLGLETMRQMINISSHPAVAIGGIDAVRLKEVVKSGAKNVAVVRAVCASSNPYEAMKTLAEIIMGE